MNIWQKFLDWCARIFQVFFDVGKWLRDVSGVAFDWIHKHFVILATGVFGVVFVFVKFLFGIIVKVVTSITDAQAQVTAALQANPSTPDSISNTFGQWLNFFNFMIPLEELFRGLLIILTIQGCLFAYRLIRKWIPTIGTG